MDCAKTGSEKEICSTVPSEMINCCLNDWLRSTHWCLDGLNCDWAIAIELHYISFKKLRMNCICCPSRSWEQDPIFLSSHITMLFKAAHSHNLAWNWVMVTIFRLFMFSIAYVAVLRWIVEKKISRQFCMSLAATRKSIPSPICSSASCTTILVVANMIPVCTC